MKKEAISHGVLDDLANRNDNWDKLDGVPEKVVELDESRQTLTNLIVNGDFRNGTQNVTNISGSISVLNNTLTSTGDGSSDAPRFYNTISNTLINHKYYMKATIKVLSSDCTRIEIYPTSVAAVAFINNPILNSSYVLSGVYNYTDRMGQFGIKHIYANAFSSNGKSIEVREMMTINLTQVFGAGNEPTKEEMDIIMDEIGYFNGTHTITSKEQFNILLKMVRENVLATTSLGGGF